MLLNSTEDRISAVKFEFSTEKYRSYWKKRVKIDCKSRWTYLVRQMVRAELSEHSGWRGKRGMHFRIPEFLSIPEIFKLMQTRISKSCTIAT